MKWKEKETRKKGELVEREKRNKEKAKRDMTSNQKKKIIKLCFLWNEFNQSQFSMRIFFSETITLGR